MTFSRSALLIVTAILLTGCGMFGGAGGRSATAPAPQPPPFMNRVWRVVEATDVPVGTYYAFLSDNTMLVTRPGAVTPALGRWHFAGGGLVLIEEGYRYPADILEWGAEQFAIRLHRRDGTADLVMVPATSPAPSASSPGAF